jgi:galactose-1-phosphate uridylyltransferase
MTNLRSPYNIVLDSIIAEAQERGIFQDGDDNLLALSTFRMMNMTSGRPSDCARSTGRAYLSNPAKFREDFIAEREAEAKTLRRW